MCFCLDPCQLIPDPLVDIYICINDFNNSHFAGLSRAKSQS